VVVTYTTSTMEEAKHFPWTILHEQADLVEKTVYIGQVDGSSEFESDSILLKG
jgi:hypothetical protein